MPRFKVKICRLSFAFKTVEVEADDILEAQQRAFDAAKSYRYRRANTQYEIDSSYQVEENGE